MTMNRQERIASARFFVWNGDKIEATPELYCLLLDADRRLRLGVTAASVELEVPVGKRVIVLTLTEVEDLLDLCRLAFTAQAAARASA